MNKKVSANNYSVKYNELTSTLIKKLFVKIENPNGSEHGVKKITVDGSVIEGILIPEKILKDKSEIIIEM